LFLARRSLSIFNRAQALLELSCRLCHLSVCLSVCRSIRKVYCGQTADWIRMPFGVVSEVGRGMGVLDDRRKGRGEFGAFHCNQWDRRRALLKLGYFHVIQQLKTKEQQYKCTNIEMFYSFICMLRAGSKRCQNSRKEWTKV